MGWGQRGVGVATEKGREDESERGRVGGWGRGRDKEREGERGREGGLQASGEVGDVPCARIGRPNRHRTFLKYKLFETVKIIEKIRW